jgi:hypothetical protein
MAVRTSALWRAVCCTLLVTFDPPEELDGEFDATCARGSNHDEIIHVDER